MKRSANRPVRTCVGCRERDEQARLMRVAVVDGRAVPDPRRRHPGRGAYIHVLDNGVPRQCVDVALRRGGLARALRVDVRDDDAVALREAAARVAERAGEEAITAKGQSR